jgi:hypothetical protein
LWYLPVIPALGELRQEDCEFESSLAYIGRLCLKKKEKKEGRQRRRMEGRNVAGGC